MKLKQIVCDGTTLNLIKEKKVIEYKEVFEVDAEEKAKEILSATYKNKPVAELVKETIKDKVPSQVKQGTKKENKKQETK